MKNQSLIVLAVLSLAGFPAQAAAQYQTQTFSLDQTNLTGGTPPYGTVQLEVNNSTTTTINGLTPSSARITYTIDQSSPGMSSAWWIGVGFNSTATLSSGQISIHYDSTTRGPDASGPSFGSFGGYDYGFRDNPLGSYTPPNIVTVTITGLTGFTSASAMITNFEVSNSSGQPWFAGHIKGLVGFSPGATGDFAITNKSSVPEPSSLLLVAAGGGMGLVGWVLRRRRRRDAHPQDSGAIGCP